MADARELALVARLRTGDQAAVYLADLNRELTA